jgi:hypothetical protein
MNNTEGESIFQAHRPFRLAAAVLALVAALSGCASLIPQSAAFADKSQTALSDAASLAAKVDDVVGEGASLGWLRASAEVGRPAYEPTDALDQVLRAATNEPAFLGFVCGKRPSYIELSRHIGMLGAVSDSVAAIAKQDPQTLGATVKAMLQNSAASADKSVRAPTAAECVAELKAIADPAHVKRIYLHGDVEVARSSALSTLSDALSKITTVLKIVERYQRSGELRKLALRAQQSKDVQGALGSLPEAMKRNTEQAEPVLLAQAFVAFRDAGGRGTAAMGAGPLQGKSTTEAAGAAVAQLRRFQSMRAKQAEELGSAIKAAFDAYFNHAQAFGNKDAEATLDALMKFLNDIETLRGLKD